MFTCHIVVLLAATISVVHHPPICRCHYSSGQLNPYSHYSISEIFHLSVHSSFHFDCLSFSACLILQRFVYQTVLYWVSIGVFLVQLADTYKRHTPFLIHPSYPGFIVFALITITKETCSLNKVFPFVQFSYTVNSMLYKRL